MSTVLITGASGFIGGALRERLQREGSWRILAPTHSELDLSLPLSESALPEAIDVLVHCAASRSRYDQDETRWPEETAINVASTARLYDWARRRRVQAIVHMSTISVFQPSTELSELLTEDSPKVTAPCHPYGLTKRWGEEMAISLRCAFDAIAVVRPGMTYGPGQSALSACSRMANAVRDGDTQKIAAPRGHRLAPVFIDDVVDVLARLVAAPKNIEVNVAGPDALLQEELLAFLTEHLRASLRIHVDTAERAHSVAPSTTRVDELFPARTKTTWREGVQKTFGRP